MTTNQLHLGAFLVLVLVFSLFETSQSFPPQPSHFFQYSTRLRNSSDDDNANSFLQKYQRRSQLLEEALLNERRDRQKLQQRLRVLQQRVFRDSSDVDENDDVKDDKGGNRNENEEDYRNVSSVSDQLNVVILEQKRQLEVQHSRIQTLSKEKVDLENEISKLDLQLQKQVIQHDKELNEIEGALFKVEKELKAERLRWNAREEDLMNKVTILRDQVKLMEENMKQLPDEVALDVTRKEKEKNLKERESILSNRVALLQEELTKQRQVVSKVKGEQTSLEEQVQRLKIELQMTQELASRYQREKLEVEVELKNLQKIELQIETETPETVPDIPLFEADATLESHKNLRQETKRPTRFRRLMTKILDRISIVLRRRNKSDKKREKSYLDSLQNSNSANTI